MKILSLILLCLCIIEINTGAKAQKVIDYAKKQVGKGYCWGTSGQVMTEQLLQRLVKAHGADNVKPDIQRQKNMGKVVFDCAGLVSKAFNEVGIRIAGGATSAWRGTSWAKKGPIGERPGDQVVILYRQKGDKMQHTGIYITGGQFIHAKGTNSGVLQESMSSYPWTHYGIPKNFDIDGGDTPIPIPGDFPFQAKVIAEKGSTVNLRNKPNGKVIKRINLGETVTVTGEESGWYKVTYQGLNGYMMTEFLQKL